MKYKWFIFLWFILFTYSCRQEEETHSSATFINTTEHIIYIKGFAYGIQMNNYYTLNPKSKLEITEMRFTSKGKGLSGFNNLYLINSDSLIVEYDTLYPVVHVRYDDLAENRPKVIGPSNNRGIMNVNNWEVKSVEKSRNMYNYYEYTFTEEDYNFAKE